MVLYGIICLKYKISETPMSKKLRENKHRKPSKYSFRISKRGLVIKILEYAYQDYDLRDELFKRDLMGFSLYDYSKAKAIINGEVTKKAKVIEEKEKWEEENGDSALPF